ncbi:HAD-IIIA family hydrolase [Massilia sp. W12]|uniref:HAD-IIIA family hydrolase n=1 Tax=Massilia sp. W12 TaxID=3126507 RepID=UPI0030D4A391
MHNRQFDLIVFDWDGTLMDSTATIVAAIQAAARDLQLPTPSQADASWVIGMGLAEAMQRIAPDLAPSQYQQMMERYHYHYVLRKDETVLFDGVPHMLDELAQMGYQLAVATGKSRAGLERAMHDSGLQHRFDATRCADETFSKPHPAMLLELCEQLGHAPERCVMIGDTTHDLQMAQNAGAHGVAVSYGAHPDHLLDTCRYLYKAASAGDLHLWLKQHGH